MSAILNLQTSFSFCLCGHGARFRCDWKKSAEEICGRTLCEKHGKEVAPGKHLCRLHLVQYESWKRRHPEKVLQIEVGVQQPLFAEGTA